MYGIIHQINFKNIDVKISFGYLKLKKQNLII